MVWDEANRDHPDTETDDPLWYKLLKADFVVRGGKWFLLVFASLFQMKPFFD